MSDVSRGMDSAVPNCCGCVQFLYPQNRRVVGAKLVYKEVNNADDVGPNSVPPDSKMPTACDESFGLLNLRSLSH